VYKSQRHRPHKSPQGIELPFIIDYKDDGAHPIELGSEFSHEPVDDIKVLFVYKLDMQDTISKDTHNGINICTSKIDDQSELKRYVLFIP
jgi:hypothetical protein